MRADSCTQESITDDPETLRGARQVFVAKKQELRDRLVQFPELADNLNGQGPHKNDANVVTNSISQSADPKYSSTDAFWPHSDHPIKS